jgi:hypothetical protein
MPKRQRGRPPGAVPIERNPERFEIAAWRAFVGMRVGPFDAARRALLAVKGGTITMQDVEGVLLLASAEIPLPAPDPDEPDAGLRRLAAKAQRQKPSKWLNQSVGLIQGLILFSGSGNVTGMTVALDALDQLGWGPVILGLTQRIQTALQSNLPPADLEKLSPAARRLLAERRGGGKK